MQAVILAAGEGRRLGPLTKGRPKALIPVANRPILQYPIESLLDNGIRDIIVVVGYRKEQVTRYLNQLEVPISVVVQEKQLGTADALRCAEPLIHDDFLLLPGDNYIDAISIGRIAGLRNSMLVREHQSPSNFGVVTVRKGVVTGIVEKPADSPSFMVSTGVFSLSREFFGFIEENDLTDAVARMIASGETLRAVEATDWQDALYPWDLLRMNGKLLARVQAEKDGEISREAVISGSVSIGKGTRVGPYTVITGPVTIGHDCEIGPHCVVSPYTSIGSRVRIEPFSVVGNSLLMDDLFIGPHSSVNGAVVGEGSTFADHTSVLPAEGIIEVEGELLKTGFGAIVGGRVTTGPFTTFRNSIIGNGVTILSAHRSFRSEHIPDDAMVV